MLFKLGEDLMQKRHESIWTRVRGRAALPSSQGAQQDIDSPEILGVVQYSGARVDNRSKQVHDLEDLRSLCPWNVYL